MKLTKIASAGLLALFAGTSADAHKVIPPPTMADLATTWLGGEQAGLEYVGLRLAADGTGSMAIQYLPQQPAEAYRITKTKLDKYKVVFEVTPAGASAEAIYLRGTAISNRMVLELGGTKVDWKRSILLERREAVIARIEAVDTRLRESEEEP